MTAAEQCIRDEITREGAISFARFMELALYAPGSGYYARGDRAIGRRGDFYTSVSVGPAFGFLLAARLAAWGGAFERLEWVEAGAHDGRLAADILGALERFYPGIWARVRYGIVEPNADRRAVQTRALERWRDRVTWWSDWSERTEPVEGVIFANELLDAFPVQRFVWNHALAGWSEVYVTFEAGTGRLVECGRPVDSPLESSVEAAVGPVLPDGFVVERSPGAESWWRTAGERLGRGWLVTADYGFDEPSGLRPEQPSGTLRAYREHRVSGSLLEEPGSQDLTAHVDFGRIRAVGEEAGLTSEPLLPQGRWLSAVAMEVLTRGGPPAEWLGSQARQLQTLTHPAHLGQVMKVLVQRR